MQPTRRGLPDRRVKQRATRVVAGDLRRGYANRSYLPELGGKAVREQPKPMRPVSLFYVGLLACLIPTAVNGSYVDGSKLQELLAVAAEAEQGRSKGVEDAYGSGFVIGYIAGVADTYNGLLLCRTPEVPLRQIVAVVKQYVDEHPADRSRPAEWIVLKALSSAFPCPR